MNITPAGNVPSVIAQANTGDAVAITVLKKTLDIEAQEAMQLIQALPQVAASNPPNLGNRIDTSA
ncbi:MAG: YjfB family protein [Propionivibrio sp.]